MADQNLEFALAGTYQGLDNRLIEIPITWTPTRLAASGRFFYLAMRQNAPSVEELSSYLYWRIIPYCLPRSVRKQYRDRYITTGDDRYQHEPVDKARRLFIKARKELKTGGEPAEVLLFTIMEGFVGAPQVASKMYLKTSERMPVHGSDGVHVLADPESDSLTFFWGESKLYESLAGAFDAICESIAGFYEIKDGRSPRDRDIDIIQDHVDFDNPHQKQLLIDHFDPYHENSNKRREAHVCLAGFDWTPPRRGTNGLTEAAYAQKLSHRLTEACKLFETKICKAGLDAHEFFLILLPFPSVKEFRKHFLAHLGVDDVE